MKPKPQGRDAVSLFQAHFRQIFDPEHPLFQLADTIDWPRFDVAFAGSYCEDFGARQAEAARQGYTRRFAEP